MATLRHVESGWEGFELMARQGAQAAENNPRDRGGVGR